MNSDSLDYIGSSSDCLPKEKKKSRSHIKKSHDVSQKKKLSLTKEQNLIEERLFAAQCEQEYNDKLWEITLKHIGKVQTAESLQAFFDKAIEEETFALEKELVSLKTSLSEERASLERSLKTASRPIPRAPMDPKLFAQSLYRQLNIPDNSNEFRVMAQMIKKERMFLRTQKAAHKPTPKKEHVSHEEPNPLKGHIEERKKLEHAIKQTDRFIRKIRK